MFVRTSWVGSRMFGQVPNKKEQQENEVNKVQKESQGQNKKTDAVPNKQHVRPRTWR